MLDAKTIEDAGIYEFELTILPKMPSIGISASEKFVFTAENLCKKAKFEDVQIPDLSIMKQSQAYQHNNFINYFAFPYFPKSEH